MRRDVLVLGVVLLVVWAMVYVNRVHLRAAQSKNVTVLQAKPAEPESDPVVSSPGPMAAPAGLRNTIVRAPTSVYARYEAATDVFPLAQELRERAEHGDADAVGPLDRIRSECFLFMVSPATRADASYLPRLWEKVDPSSTGPIEAALARRTARCQRFTRADLVEHDQQMALLRSAAAKGDPQALARFMSMDLEHVPDATLVADVNDVVASGDPEAINDLASVMSQRTEGRQQLFDLPSGSERSSWAWVSAACQLGLDCGPNGQVLQDACLSGSCYPSVDALIRDAILPPREYRQMLKDEQKILARIGH